MEPTNETAPQEAIYQPEAELSTATAADQIKHIRALNTNGESVNVTPTQIREMVGIDYSSLTEQPVPGEFALDRNGVRKQVYTKTYIGTTPTIRPSASSYPIATISPSFIVVGAFSAHFMSANWWHNYMDIVSSSNGQLIMIINTDTGLNAKYILTVKYVK